MNLFPPHLRNIAKSFFVLFALCFVLYDEDLPRIMRPYAGEVVDVRWTRDKMVHKSQYIRSRFESIPFQFIRKSVLIFYQNRKHEKSPISLQWQKKWAILALGSVLLTFIYLFFPYEKSKRFHARRAHGGLSNYWRTFQLWHIEIPRSYRKCSRYNSYRRYTKYRNHALMTHSGRRRTKCHRFAKCNQGK